MSRKGTHKKPTVCRIRDCGRPAYDGERLCQSHHRQKAEGRKIVPVRLYHKRTVGSVKYGTLRLTQKTAKFVEEYAKKHGLAPSAALATIVEETAGS